MAKPSHKLINNHECLCSQFIYTFVVTFYNNRSSPDIDNVL